MPKNAPTGNGKLTDKQAQFVHEYLIDRNGTQAAIRAGYSAKTAQMQASRLLTNAMVRAAIDTGLSDLAHRVGISSEMVLRERKRIAFFDPRKLLDKDGFPIPIQDLDADTAAAIAGLDVVQMSSNDIPCVIKKYRLATKDNSLAALEKYFGLNEKAVRFTLPRITDAADCTKAQAALLCGVANGTLLLSEGHAMANMINALRQAHETSTLAAQLKDIQADLDKLKGKTP